MCILIRIHCLLVCLTVCVNMPGEGWYASPHHGSQRLWQELSVSDLERPVAHLRRTTHQATALDALLHSTEVRVQWRLAYGLVVCV